MRQVNTQISILGEWEEGGTVDDGEKVTQERMTDSDREKVTAKKEAEKPSSLDKKRLTKEESWKNHTLFRSIRHPVCM